MKKNINTSINKYILTATLSARINLSHLHQNGPKRSLEMPHRSLDGGPPLVSYSTPLYRFRWQLYEVRATKKPVNPWKAHDMLTSSVRPSICLSQAPYLSRLKGIQIRESSANWAGHRYSLDICISLFQFEFSRWRNYSNIASNIFLFFYLPPLILEFQMLESEMIMYCDLITRPYAAVHISVTRHSSMFIL